MGSVEVSNINFSNWPRHRVLLGQGGGRRGPVPTSCCRRSAVSLTVARGHLRVLTGHVAGTTRVPSSQQRVRQGGGHGGQWQEEERDRVKQAAEGGDMALCGESSSSDLSCAPCCETQSSSCMRLISSHSWRVHQRSSECGDWMMMVVPAMLDEDMVDVSGSIRGEANVQEQILSIIGASSMAPLYSAQIKGNRTLYWVASMGLQVNERAERETGIGGVCGDAVIVQKLKASNPEENPTAAVLHNAVVDEEEKVDGHMSRKYSKKWALAPEHAQKQDDLGSIAARKSTVDHLPTCVLQLVFSFLTFMDLCNAAATCKTWRTCIADDQHLLLSLDVRKRAGFEVPPPLFLGIGRKRFRNPAVANCTHHHLLPFVLLHAAEAGNLKAMLLVAEEMEAQGLQSKALEWLKKTAKKGHQASQYKVGEAFYRGEGDCVRDGEEALLWLLRAIRNPNQKDHISAGAALLLGYMHLDGEGVQRNNTEAVKWLRLSAELGSAEAEKALGWLWNTGQY